MRHGGRDSIHDAVLEQGKLAFAVCLNTVGGGEGTTVSLKNLALLEFQRRNSQVVFLSRVLKERSTQWIGFAAQDDSSAATPVGFPEAGTCLTKHP